MNTFKILLANSDRRVTNLIESLVRDVCRDRVIIDCTRCSRLNELLNESCQGNFDLIIFTPESLMPNPTRHGSRISMADAASAIRTMNNWSSTPIICAAVSPECELILSEAGADMVLGLPFNCEALKSAVQRLVSFPQPSETVAVLNSSFSDLLKRGLQRFAARMAFSKSPVLETSTAALE